MIFPCEKCGSCCRAAGCQMLVGNECSIYETRPLVCRIDAMAAIRGWDLGHAYAVNKTLCKQVQGRF